MLLSGTVVLSARGTTVWNNAPPRVEEANIKNQKKTVPLALTPIESFLGACPLIRENYLDKRT